jgi:hypothetical protein
MFKCDACKRTVGPRIQELKQVIKSRSKTYNVVSFNEYGDPSVSGKSQGFETVKEVKLCPLCHAEIEGVSMNRSEFLVDKNSVRRAREAFESIELAQKPNLTPQRKYAVED